MDTNTPKSYAVSALRWSALSLVGTALIVTSLLVSAWVSLQVLVFLIQQ